MGDETELKFEVAPQDLQKLKAARIPNRGTPKEKNLVSVYFDSPKHKLARNGVSLRVRHNSNKRIQTVKAGGRDGSITRGEWQHEIKGDIPDLRKAHGTPLSPLLTKKLKRKLPLFETRIHRASIPIRKNGSRIEVALDNGQIRAGWQSAPISELELELKHGRASDAFKLARALAKRVPTTLSLKSKAERGYELIDDAPARAVRAEKIKLPRGMSTADAFRVIGRRRKAKKRLSRFRGRLKDLQDRLGALNDIKVHQKLAPQIAAGRRPHKNGRARAFAAGTVSGREQSEIEPLLNAANGDARKFGRIHPFWT